MSPRDVHVEKDSGPCRGGSSAAGPLLRPEGRRRAPGHSDRRGLRPGRHSHPPPETPDGDRASASAFGSHASPYADGPPVPGSAPDPYCNGNGHGDTTRTLTLTHGSGCGDRHHAPQSARALIDLDCHRAPYAALAITHRDTLACARYLGAASLAVAGGTGVSRQTGGILRDGAHHARRLADRRMGLPRRDRQRCHRRDAALPSGTGRPCGRVHRPARERDRALEPVRSRGPDLVRPGFADRGLASGRRGVWRLDRGDLPDRRAHGPLDRVAETALRARPFGDAKAVAMTLSSEALALVRRLEAFQLRQLRLLARLESEAEEAAALTAGREMVNEILAHAWGDQPLRNRDLRDLQKLADDIDREFLPILEDLESRLPGKPARRAKRRKPVFEGFAGSASFHRQFEGPEGAFGKRGRRSAIEQQRETMAWDALELAEASEILEALDLADRVLQSQNLVALQALATVCAVEALLLNAEETARRGIEEAARQLGGDSPDSREWYGELETRNYMRLKHQLAMILDAQGRLDEAVEILRDLLARNPNDNQAIRFVYPSLLLREGRNEQALSAFEEIGQQYPDDIPEPAFLLNWSLALLCAGRLPEAVVQARRAALSNLYLIPILLDRPAAAHPIWHGIDTSEPPWAKDYAGSFGNLWMSDKRARSFLRRFWDDEETQQDVTRLVSLGKLLLQLQGHTGRKSEKQWAGLIADRRAIEENPPSPETVRRVIRALGV